MDVGLTGCLIGDHGSEYFLQEPRPPVERWDDDVTWLAGGDWLQVALNSPLWNKLGIAYVVSSV